jgi:hypothetical protein
VAVVVGGEVRGEGGEEVERGGGGAYVKKKYLPFHKSQPVFKCFKK